jgi:hypothetical protein
VGLEFEGEIPFYHKPWFLVILNFLGLAHISLIIMLNSFPGETTFGVNGKKMLMKVPKILLF